MQKSAKEKPVTQSLLDLAHSISAWGKMPVSTRRLLLTLYCLGTAFAVSLLAVYFGLEAGWVVLVASLAAAAGLGIAELVTRAGIGRKKG